MCAPLLFRCWWSGRFNAAGEGGGPVPAQEGARWWSHHARPSLCPTVPCSWGMFRDRRPDLYGAIATLDGSRNAR